MTAVIQTCQQRDISSPAPERECLGGRSLPSLSVDQQRGYRGDADSMLESLLCYILSLLVEKSYNS